MAKRRRRRIPKMKPRRRRRRLMASKIGPWLKVLGILAIIAGVIVLLVKLVFPPMLQMMGVDWPPATSAPATPTPVPTPTPHPLTALEPTQYLNDIDVSTNDLRYAADPYRHGDKIYFSAGRDADGGPHYRYLYEFDITTGEQQALESIRKEHDDIFQARVNENWIVFLDNKREGGGDIRVLDRRTDTLSTVKTYYSGMPTIALEGDLLAWMERTGTNMDKAFLYNLSTRENMTAAMLERSNFGQSDVDISETELIWADVDPSASTAQKDELAVINYLSLGASTETKKVQSFTTGTYVHDPKTNGVARAWTDAPAGPSPNLYLSVNGGEPEYIAGNVTGYDLGSDFIAYCSEEVMYVRFWGARGFDRQISLQGEKCIFAGVSNDTVFYYVTGGVSANDIIKYAAVNELEVDSARPAIPTLNILTTPAPLEGEAAADDGTVGEASETAVGQGEGNGAEE